MAKRRMFSIDVIDTDIFMDMPQSSRLLYYELCMRADDDGFVANPKKIIKIVGCSQDDFKVLISKKFVIVFNTGIVVITHWKIHNYIQKDRYKETLYTNEKKQLGIDENSCYYLVVDTECIHYGYTGKDRKEIELEKDKKYYTYECHLNKDEKDSFCLNCEKKKVCNKKTSLSFIQLFGKTFEDYIKNINSIISYNNIVDFNWLDDDIKEE